MRSGPELLGNHDKRPRKRTQSGNSSCTESAKIANNHAAASTTARQKPTESTYQNPRAVAGGSNQQPPFMACSQPVRAWQMPGGKLMWREPLDRKDNTRHMKIPCGRCLGCRTSRARDWAIRCQLELQQHSTASFVTLTYEDRYLPPTLTKSHVSSFVRSVRRYAATGSIRFFACGEYGERNSRPHYHAILYGLSERGPIESAWRKGHIQIDQVSPASIAYVAGYCNKKLSQHRYNKLVECVDPNTGEVFHWQDPFTLMSRKPGIGSHAREWWRSWRTKAVHQGHEVPVPRYLHQAWQLNATPAEIEALEKEKAEACFLYNRSPEELAAMGANALARHAQKAEKRYL